MKNSTINLYIFIKKQIDNIIDMRYETRYEIFKKKSFIIQLCNLSK